MKQKETLGSQGNRPRKASTAPRHICANPPGTCSIVLLTIRSAMLFHGSAHTSPAAQIRRPIPSAPFLASCPSDNPAPAPIGPPGPPGGATERTAFIGKDDDLCQRFMPPDSFNAQSS